MTLYTSGDWKVDFGGEVTHDVFDFCCEQWNPLKDAEIEVNQCDLTEDGGFGFCQVDEDGEFLIHIHNDLCYDEYVKTLIHELTHVRQTLTGLLDHERREEDAYFWEELLSNEFYQQKL